MKAAYLKEKENIIFKNIDKPEPGPNEVLVKVKSVGLCGSDMHYYKHGKIGDYVVEDPLILGHESAGEVEKIGEKVEGLKKGDRVAIEPGVPCGKCDYCRTGKYNLCPDVIFMATPPIDGAFAEFVTSPPEYLFKLPENVSFEEGAMVEPLAVGMNAAKKANIKLGDKVLILGAGAIGLVTLQAVKAAGAADITVTDLNELRLGKAINTGASTVINVENEEIPEPETYDVVIETAGVKSTAQQALKLVKRGGRVVLVGLTPEGTFSFPVNQILDKELTVEGIFRYANLYQRAINLISSGMIDVDTLITDRFNFEDVDKAFVHADQNANKIIKLVVNFD